MREFCEKKIGFIIFFSLRLYILYTSFLFLQIDFTHHREIKHVLCGSNVAGNLLSSLYIGEAILRA